MRFILVGSLLLFALGASAQTITGIVVDGSGAAIEKASVTLKDRTSVQTTTDDDGHFSLAGTITNRTILVVTAKGFAPFERRLAPNGVFDFTIVLQPASINEGVTVSITGTETRLRETPASVVALTREHLDSTAAQTVDDTLRQVAGFTLFRRGSSKTTNPTAQGANLRGVSGSGASRTAVLFDGLSLNDAFGGWTYWSRVPRVAIEQAEVLRGGASSLYGSGGLSGAVDLTTFRPSEGERVLRFETSAGTLSTFDGSVFGAIARKRWAFDITADAFTTGGYIPAAENERGAVDTPANSNHTNLIAGVERRFRSEPPASAGGQNAGSNSRIFFRGSIFDEDRDNGTSLTYNKTNFRQFALGGDLENASVGRFELRAFLQSQDYDQTFSAVSADRNTETLTRIQKVPSQAAGGSLNWTRTFGDHAVSSSVEYLDVRGFSDEIGFVSGSPTSVSSSGGRSQTFAVLAQNLWRANERLTISLGGRFDCWENLDASFTTRSFSTNNITTTLFPDRTERAFSPRIAAIISANDNISIYGSYSRSFRAPTLNELYRGFRVGNVVTLANENLTDETANTFEAGADIRSRRFSVRGNVFNTTVTDPVVSITLTSTPALITRQRQNVGETRANGLELDAEFAITDELRLSTSYLLVSSRITDFPANPDLVGKFLPQVAPQQFTFQLSYRPPTRFSFGIQGRISSGQWEDDLNTLRLDPYFTMDATVAYRINKNVDLFLASENIFNSRYDIGLTPVRTVAAPAFIRAGLRLNLGGK